MSKIDITSLTLAQTRTFLEQKELTYEEINRAYLERINRLDPQLNCYLSINKNGKGIPAAIKDLISTKGLKTTAGSKILEDYQPVFDATVVLKLAAEGISTIGKTNLDEFAMGSSGENSAFGATKNPWDMTKIPGGSSSGSAVAVAADLAVFSIGTDTGGSIRQPASLCGVVGFKPSYGLCSRYGLIAMASSLDQPGPFTKSVEDAKLVMQWIQGSDEYDSNVVDHKINFLSPGLADLKGVKIGIPTEYFGDGLDKKVEQTILQAIKQLEQLGAEMVEVSLPHTESAIAVYYILMPSEVSSNLGRFTGIRYGGGRDLFGDEPKRRIMLGTFALSTGYFDDYFIKAAQVRTLIKQDFEQAFKKCDVIVSPVSPTVAWNLGEKVNDPLQMYLSDAYTIPASLAGLPGVSVPCGFVDGLPVGLQILGPYLGDKKVLDVAEVYEQATDWHKEKPKL